jgi:hypothetical protein
MRRRIILRICALRILPPIFPLLSQEPPEKFICVRHFYRRSYGLGHVFMEPLQPLF